MKQIEDPQFQCKKSNKMKRKAKSEKPKIHVVWHIMRQNCKLSGWDKTKKEHYEQQNMEIGK